jgi:hypothetical protein
LSLIVICPIGWWLYPTEENGREIAYVPLPLLVVLPATILTSPKTALPNSIYLPSRVPFPIVGFVVDAVQVGV